MLNRDFGYPNLVPAKPTYIPDCDCHNSERRNSPDIVITPAEAIYLLSEGIRPTIDLIPFPRNSLFRTRNSWTVTPIGER